MRIEFLFAFLLPFIGLTAAAKSCKDFKSKNVPCVEVPACSSGRSKIVVNQLWSGLARSVSESVVEFCHEKSQLRITNTALAQKYFPNATYADCNDGIFNLDVSEAFIAPYIEADAGAYCYSELDLSPKNQIYESGIYNPNLNHTGLSNSELTCSTAGVTHSVSVSPDLSSWVSTLNVPWSVVNCPKGCPLQKYCSVSETAAEVYRLNMYRVNELVATSKCSSSVCEYMAWSPTFSASPSFHEPKYFGFLVVV